MVKEEYDFCRMLVEKFEFDILVTDIMGYEQFWMMKGAFNPKGFHQPYHEMIDAIELTDIIKNRSFNSIGNRASIDGLTASLPKISMKFGSDKFLYIYKVNFGI